MQLIVHTWTLAMPPDYPLPELVHVVDLDRGGRVQGAVTLQDHTLRFTPANGWRPNTRYAWTVNPLQTPPHGPESSVEAGLVGTAAFDTTPRLDLLAAVVPSPQKACMVWSRPLTTDDTGELRITIDDAEVTADAIILDLVPRAEWGVSFDLEPEDPGVNILCMRGEAETVPLTPGSILRVWWGNEGPWREELAERSLADAVGLLRRLTPPDGDIGTGSDTGSDTATDTGATP